jgi:hypothetical protein
MRLFRMRRLIRQERAKVGRCENCGKAKQCERWCWGPKIRDYLSVVIRNPKAAKFAWSSYKHELHWAGVEPWHRY